MRYRTLVWLDLNNQFVNFSTWVVFASFPTFFLFLVFCVQTEVNLLRIPISPRVSNEVSPKLRKKMFSSSLSFRRWISWAAHTHTQSTYYSHWHSALKRIYIKLFKCLIFETNQIKSEFLHTGWKQNKRKTNGRIWGEGARTLKPLNSTK